MKIKVGSYDPVLEEYVNYMSQNVREETKLEHSNFRYFTLGGFRVLNIDILFPETYNA